MRDFRASRNGELFERKSDSCKLNGTESKLVMTDNNGEAKNKNFISQIQFTFRCRSIASGVGSALSQTRQEGG